MAERPILFSGPMVRAILAGHKTQTRRLVKYIPALGEPNEWCPRVEDPALVRVIGDVRRFCPYGVPGDRLWVRETWAAYTKSGGECPECDEIECSPSEMPDRYGTDRSDVVYAADGESHPSRWRPSIHMPRWASRLTLEITDVRVERLQDITEEDATAEGIRPLDSYMNEPGWYAADPAAPDATASRTAVNALGCLWDSINGNRAAWVTNPWVWVLSFRAVSP